MQKGFSLLELLTVSFFGGLLLLAASQGIAQLLQQQNYLSQAQRLHETAALAEVALVNSLAKSASVFAWGTADSAYPSQTARKIAQTVQGDLVTRFDNFASSDWLALATEAQELKFLHVDKKTYSQGLAYKSIDLTKLATDNSDAVSQALVNQVEMLRLRFYSTQQQRWVRPSQLDATEQIQQVQIAVVLVSEQPVTRAKPTQLTLWHETLNVPQDGRLRRLVVVTGRLVQLDSAAQTTPDEVEHGE